MERVDGEWSVCRLATATVLQKDFKSRETESAIILMGKPPLPLLSSRSKLAPTLALSVAHHFFTQQIDVAQQHCIDFIDFITIDQ